ncbi:hypothetical protein AX764_00390 [Oenococcus oeni]|nr:hypothetical protein AX764_00390 [Oenococcus oeni]
MIKYDEKIPDLVKSIFGKSEKCFKNDESKQDGDHSHEYSQVSNWKRGLALPNHEDYKKVKKHYQDKGEHISNFEFLYSNTPQKYIDDFFSNLISKIEFTYSPKLIDHSEEDKKEAADINEFSLKHYNDDNFESLLKQHITGLVGKRESDESHLKQEFKKNKNKRLTHTETKFKNQFVLLLESNDPNFLINYEKGGRILKYGLLIEEIRKFVSQHNMNDFVHLEKIDDNDIQNTMNTIIINQISEMMKQQRSKESWSMEGKVIKLYRETLKLMSSGSQQPHRIKNITINQIEKNTEKEDSLEERKKLVDSQSDIIFDNLLEEFQNKLSEQYFKLKELKESLH